MSFSQEVTVVQLSEKEKQALQEKYKAQRQTMWSGKQSASPDSEEETGEEHDNQTAPVDSSEPTGTDDEETNQDDSSVQTGSHSEGQAFPVNPTQNVGDGEETSQSPTEATPTTEDTGKEDEQTGEGERVFWEPGMEGGPNILTWKLVLAVIGIGIILIGVGVWLGFWFAG